MKKLENVKGVPKVEAQGMIEMSSATIFYFAQEWAKNGQPLHQYAQNQQSNYSDKVEKFISVCEIVNLLHGEEIIHADLKPYNLLIDDKAQCWVIDLGLASWYQGLAIQGEGRSALYASPEQMNDERITHKTDIFSLGVILCQLLTGEVPRQIKGDQLVTQNAREVSRRLSNDLCEIIDTCLSEEPCDRYDSVGALIEKLKTANRESIEGKKGAIEREIKELPKDAKSRISYQTEQKPTPVEQELDSSTEKDEGAKKEEAEFFPDDAHLAIQEELDRILSRQQKLAEFIEKSSGGRLVERNSKTFQLKRNLFEGVQRDFLPEVLKDISDNLSPETGQLGVGGLEELRVFLGGILVLRVDQKAIREFRRNLFEGILEVGNIGYSLRGDLKKYWVDLSVVYRAALAGEICDVAQVIKLKEKGEGDEEGPVNQDDLGKFPEVADGTDTWSISKTASDLIAVRATASFLRKHWEEDEVHFDDDDFRRMVEDAEDMAREGRAYFVFHPSWMDHHQAIMEGWSRELFRFVCFFNKGKSPEDILPGYHRTMKALCILLNRTKEIEDKI